MNDDFVGKKTVGKILSFKLPYIFFTNKLSVTGVLPLQMYMLVLGNVGLLR